MPPQYKHGLPNTTDPVKLAEFIVQHEKKVAPIDLLQLGVHLTREFGGMKKFAEKLRMMADNVDLPPRDRMRVYEITLNFLQKTAELYPRPIKPRDLNSEQLAACIRYAQNMADPSRRLDDPGDAFGN